MLYPVKSLRGIAVEQWPVTTEGLHYDRNWMLVSPNGRFVTQRQLPQMALIDTAIDGEQLVLSAAGKGQVSVPLSSAHGLTSSIDRDVFAATLWRDRCEVIEVTQAASAWLTTTLQAPYPLRLVAMAGDHQRPQSQPERFGLENHTRFADAAPLLVANQKSLDALNTALIKENMAAVEMRRFRPNLVVSGIPAFAEHTLAKGVRADGLMLHLRDRCERCTIITVDPNHGTAAPDMEPYHTLAALNPMPSNPRSAVFAANATLALDATATRQPLLSVGDCFDFPDAPTR